MFCLTSSPLTEISLVAWTRLNSPLHVFLCSVHGRSFISIGIMSACLGKWRNYEILEDLSRISSDVLLIYRFPYFPYIIIEIFVSTNISSLTSRWSSFYSWGWSTLKNLLISTSKNNLGFCQSQNMYLDALFFPFVHFPIRVFSVILLLICKNLYIFYIRHLLIIYILNIFSQSLACLFILSNVCLSRSFLILISVWLAIFMFLISSLP